MFLVLELSLKMISDNVRKMRQDHGKVEEIDARQHVLFSGLNSGLTNKAAHAPQECLTAVY